MNYYIGDLHLFHRNVTDEGKNFDNRPFKTLDEMHRVIVERWNKRVTERDTVYILGDVSMHSKMADLIPVVSELKGHKFLIRGNHDKISNVNYRALYDDIFDYKEVKERYNDEKVRLVLSHYPILFWNHQHNGSILLYGHVHNTREEDFFQKCVKEIDWIEEHDAVAINVGCMMSYMDYTPRTLTEIIDGYKEMVSDRND